jgi:hypothetical protein
MKINSCGYLSYLLALLTTLAGFLISPQRTLLPNVRR